MGYGNQFFRIYQCVSGPENSAVGKFVIVETNFTSDGFRSRVCDGMFSSREEADTALVEKEKKNA